MSDFFCARIATVQASYVAELDEGIVAVVKVRKT